MKKYLSTNNRYKLQLVNLFNTSEVILTETASGKELYAKSFSRESDAKKHFEEMTSNYWMHLPKEIKQEEAKKAVNKPVNYYDYLGV
ncbi:MAG: hypothetical protein OXF77_00945 [Thaumarchaeota archaeon]|nr:hypothetical protein [Nitrososphaerota archaeon]